MFKPRPNANTKIETIFEETKVYITTNAYAKMTHIVNMCNKEVGWLGTAEWVKDNNLIVISDILLFNQEVSRTTCEITPEGLAKFAEEILQQENGIEIWNSIKLWGHSHVNMGVSPSGQDDSQMKVFADHNDWFLRIIANKSGELKIDLYDYESNLSYLDLKWELFIPELIASKEFIESEIKEKVKEKTYSCNYGYAYGYGYRYNKNKKEDKEDEKKEKEYNNIKELNEHEDYEYYKYCPSLEIYEYFTKDEIIKIAESPEKEYAIEAIKEILGITLTQRELENLYKDCLDEYMEIILDEYNYDEGGIK